MQHPPNLLPLVSESLTCPLANALEVSCEVFEQWFSLCCYSWDRWRKWAIACFIAAQSFPSLPWNLEVPSELPQASFLPHQCSSCMGTQYLRVAWSWQRQLWADRSWIQYRIGSCNFTGDKLQRKDGTFPPYLFYHSCLKQLTACGPVLDVCLSSQGGLSYSSAPLELGIQLLAQRYYLGR